MLLNISTLFLDHVSENEWNNNIFKVNIKWVMKVCFASYLLLLYLSRESQPLIDDRHFKRYTNINEENEEKTNIISIFGLFRYANRIDRIRIASAICLSIANSLFYLLYIILFGNLTSIMVLYPMSACSLSLEQLTKNCSMGAQLNQFNYLNYLQ